LKMSDRDRRPPREDQTLLYYLEDPAVVLSRKGRVAYSNPAFHRLFRLSGSSLSGRPLQELSPAWFHEPALSRLSELDNGGGSRSFWVGDDKKRFQAVLKGILVDGRLAGALLTLHQWREGAEFDRLNLDLFQLMIEDLQYPLEELKSYLKFPGDKMGEAVKRSASSQLELTNEAISRLRSFGDIFFGAARPERVSFSPGRLIRLALKSLRPVAKNKGALLEDGSSRELPMALGDPAILNRVLGLLLDYFIRIAPENELIVLSAEMLMAGDGSPLLIYSITGTGVASQDVDLSRGERTMLESFLGLSDEKKRLVLRVLLAHRLVSSLGGRLSVAAHEKAGLTICALVPAAIHYPQPAESDPATAEQQ